VRLGPLSAVWLVRTLHKTPLWALQMLRTTS
jgi:hypothetical protein